MPSLYNKYRPKQFQDVVEQNSTVTVLQNSVLMEKPAHAYLFTGPKGTGKTTLARIFSKAVNCLNPQNGEPCNQCEHCRLIESGNNLDITEIDAASHTGVENIRELKENINLAPSILKYKVYVIDEAHMLSQGAFNALLKSLEEPPSFVIFILATTEAHKIPATIASRCQRFNFKKLSFEKIKERLAKIAKEEKVKIDDPALSLVAAAAEGGMRDAESLLNQIISLEGKNITRETVQNVIGLPQTSKFSQFLKAIEEEDIQVGFQLITELAYDGFDLNYYAKELIEYLREVLLLKVNPQHAAELESKMDDKSFQESKELAQKTTTAKLGKMIAELITAKNLIKDAPLPQIPLELALINLIEKPLLLKQEPTQEKPTAPQVSNPTSKPKRREKPLNAEPAIKTKSKKIEAKPEKKEIKDQLKNAKKTPARKTQKKKTEKKKNRICSIQDIYNIWASLVKKVKENNRSLWAIIQNCEPVNINKDGSVIIKTRYPFHKARLEDPKNKQLIHQLIQEILDLDCSFCYLLESEIPKKLKENNNSAVSQVLNEFGGQIVE